MCILRFVRRDCQDTSLEITHVGLDDTGHLTGMESQVAVLLAEGMSVREIASAMGRKESTIRSHVKHMFTKHGLSRQAELVRLVLPLTNVPGSRGKRRKQP